jgi:hypothetical protein
LRCVISFALVRTPGIRKEVAEAIVSELMVESRGRDGQDCNRLRQEHPENQRGKETRL